MRGRENIALKGQPPNAPPIKSQMTTKLHVCPRCEARWNSDGLHIDPARKCAAWPGGQVRLTRMQSRLLSSLARATGRVVQRDALIDAGWGDDECGGPDGVTQALYAHMSSLRTRLARAGFPGRIKSVWGIGYELTLQAA